VSTNYLLDTSMYYACRKVQIGITNSTTPPAIPGRGSRAASTMCASSAFGRHRVAVQQRSDLRLPVSAMTAESADGRELAGLGPARHRLRVDAEQRRDLRRGEECLGFRTMANSRHC